MRADRSGRVSTVRPVTPSVGRTLSRTGTDVNNPHHTQESVNMGSEPTVVVVTGEGGDAPTQPDSPDLTPTLVDVVERITRLETRVDTLESSTVEAQITAEIAQDTAETAIDIAIEADTLAEVAAVTAVDAVEAVEAVAEITPTETDDVVVETIVEDTPARKPNIWFDPSPMGR